MTFDPALGLREVLDKISLAAKACDRDPNDITLVAVSKVHGPETIVPVLQTGHRTFGENRVQEAQAKWPALKAQFQGIKLHLIGPLQTNKVKEAVQLFDVIESVDREKLAVKLAAEMEKQGRSLPVFIQVNTGEEPQKSGIFPTDVDKFVGRCRSLGLDVRGLMCIPPVEEEPSLHFMLLEKLARRNGLADLSMGMSGDFETAIEFGATFVRVGTAVFGERQQSQ